MAFNPNDNKQHTHFNPNLIPESKVGVKKIILLQLLSPYNLPLGPCYYNLDTYSKNSNYLSK